MTSIRGAVLFADQAVASVTNLLPSFFIARALGADGLGTFAVAFAAYWLGLGGARALILEPYLLSAPKMDETVRSGYALRAAGVALRVGCIGGLLGIAVATAIPAIRPALLPIAALMPLLLLQDALRYDGFAKQRAGKALGSDVTWLVAAVTFSIPADSLWELSLAWAGAGAAAGLVFTAPRPLWQAVRTGAVGAWMRDHRDSSGFLFLEFATVSAVQQGATWIIAGTASLASAGILRAGQMFTAPLKLVQTAATIALLPRAVTMETPGLGAAARKYGFANAGLALAWAAAVLIVPVDAGRFVVGDAWPDARWVAGLLALGAAFNSLSQAALIVLKATGNFSTSAQLRLIVSSVSLAALTVGALLAEAVGAALGMLVGAVFGAALWSMGARRALEGQKT